MSKTLAYAYALPKVFSYKSSLISKDRLIHWVKTTANLEDFISELKETIYGEYLEEVAKKKDVLSIEKRLKNRLIDFEERIISLAPDEDRVFLEQYFIRHELENFKRLLRCKIQNVSPVEIYRLINIRCEEILGRKKLFDSLIKMKDLKELVKTLKATNYSEMIEEALEEYRETKNPACIDFLFDRECLVRLHKSMLKLNSVDKDVCFYILGPRFDEYNVVNILRGKRWGISKDFLSKIILEIFFGLTSQDIRLLIDLEPSKDLELLKETLYSHLVTGKNDLQIISNIEKGLERTVYLNARSSFIGDIYNIGPLISIVLLVEFEIRNLLTICSGKRNKIDDDEIIKALLLE